jgi:lactoylglutathione lyase
MPSDLKPSSFKKLTPNLLVANVERSLAFYENVLGFERGFTVPEQSPFVFASVTGGPVEIFFNDAAGAIKEYPAFGGKPIGATGTMYIEVEGVDALHDRLKATVPIVMPLVKQFYGMREFAIEDPDGYVITFAERVP